MVTSLVWERMPNRARYMDDWLRLFAELQPPETPDPDGLAVALDGIEYLIAEIRRHLDNGLSERKSLRALHDALGQLLNANRGFALFQQKEDVTPEKYASWRNAVRPLVANIIELSYGVAVAPNQ
jgi:hypothetical protein